MSTKPVGSTNVEEIVDVPKAVVDRQIGLFFELMRADIADPSVMDRVPNRASLALIPDDDPELAEFAIRAGVNGVRRGKNVYFLHVTHDADGKIFIKWPEDALSPLNQDDE